MNIIFETEGLLFPSCARTHISYAVFIEKEEEALVVDFAYSPKTADDDGRTQRLKAEALIRFDPETELSSASRSALMAAPLHNLITLSFDDAETYRGAAHRQPQTQRLELGRRGASPGLIPGPIPLGPFKLTLSVHAIATEWCSYTLRLSTEES